MVTLQLSLEMIHGITKLRVHGAHPHWPKKTVDSLHSPKYQHIKHLSQILKGNLKQT